jgi:hypothetical protein
MAYDSNYLGQNLTERTRKATHDFAVEMTQIASKMAGNGTLNSSMTFVQYWQAGLRILDREANEACKFVYNLTEEHTGDPYKQAEFCVGRMCENIILAVSEKAGHAGKLGGGYGDIVSRMRVEMEAKRDNLLADFKNGMLGSERLKKDPLLNVINNQTNSPGAIQQVGIGDNFSQSAFTQHHQELVKAIDRALASIEFIQLNQEQKDAFSDTAMVVKEEVSKPTPDVGKLKRWGGRLVELSKDIGMKVASGEIVHLLNSMFGG